MFGTKTFINRCLFPLLASELEAYRAIVVFLTVSCASCLGVELQFYLESI